MAYYEVLCVNRDSTVDAIKAAYQKLVLTLHPDKAGADSQEQFQLLQQAWQTLRCASSRALYDHQLTQAELQATVVLHDEIDLEDMEQQQEVQQQQDPVQQQQQQDPVQQQQQEGQEPDSVQIIDADQQQRQCTPAAQADGCGIHAGLAAASLVHSYPCRCGDSYLLTATDMQLASQQIIIPCRSCSNHILVRLP